MTSKILRLFLVQVSPLVVSAGAFLFARYWPNADKMRQFRELRLFAAVARPV